MRKVENTTRRIRSLFKARELLTVITLLLCLYVTHQTWRAASQSADDAVQTAFDFRVRESNERIQQRILVYEQVLRATAGLFNASRTVSRDEFNRFVRALNLAENYPGIQGIGFAVTVPPDDKEKHEAAVREEGFPSYRLMPQGERDAYTAILYLEPFKGDNLRAFGFDMFSEPVRRAAMEKARDTAQPALTGRVTLVQEGGAAPRAGFLMYLPLYRENPPSEMLAQRRQQLYGWAYAPFRMNDFMRGVAGQHEDDLDIEIYDQEQVTEASKMYDSDLTASATEGNGKLRNVGRIEASQRTWTVVTTALPIFEQSIRSDRPELVLRAGISISFLLSLLIWIFLDDRARALQAANQAMQLALYDVLTGLPNRKLLDERLQQSLAKARRDQGHVALLFIDLDQFKPVNDNYGHAYGDLLLKEVAKRLHSCMRESDTASRLGGDEFVALLPEVEGRDAVMIVANKILSRLSEPYEIAGHTFNISASIGAALYPEDGTDNKALMKAADMAMYGAKNQGRSNVQFPRVGT